jgi:Membrane dipeptidase (Peptidase family M19)
MAFSIQGFGTSFVGQRDFGADGSYITTKWVVLLFVPVIPLSSLRVKETTTYGGEALAAIATGAGAYYSKQRYLAHRVPLHLKQVFCVYGFLASYIGLPILLGAILALLQVLGVPVSSVPPIVTKILWAFVGVVVMVLPFLVAWYLRLRAKRRIAMDDVAKFLYLTRALLKRGYSVADIRKIYGGNVLSILRRAWGSHKT